MRKILKILLLVLLVLAVLLLAGGWLLFGTFLTAARSIEELEPGFYAMEYSGDYGFDEFLAQGGADSDSALAGYLTGYLSRGFYKIDATAVSNDFGCSTICIDNGNGGVLFGRNFDWEEGRVMLVHTRPKNGYEATATCALSFLGFGEDYRPDGSMAERMQSLAAVYVPLDGMNEKGLMVADLVAGDSEETHQRSEKPDLTTTTAIRLLLDHAANVEEAVALLRQYDMNSSAGMAHHLAIADAAGNSVVAEYVDGELYVTQTAIVTNHYLADCEKQGVGSQQSHLRYETLSRHTGAADHAGMRELMESVAQMNYPQNGDHYEKTLWTVVYDPGGLCADFYFSENYSHSYGLLLYERGSYVKR